MKDNNRIFDDYMHNRRPDVNDDRDVSRQTTVVADLQARIAELEAALDRAAHEMYEETGSCPSDMFDWEHPNTCIRECVKYEKPDEAWKCWLLWLMHPDPPEEQ